jgi:hypothetical protein
MGLRSVAGIVVPTTTLLNTNATPFSLGERSVLGKALRHVFCQYDMSVFVFAILVFLGVINLCSNSWIFKILMRFHSMEKLRKS